ncbi:MAG TPA: GvpL/GvpF family gas vesicle protein [Pyrinomonadaceae bacterium]|nr:GvpL/GvpF family gas vesicle protein [Pyrinomonadaceae bacterium]
MAGSDDNQRGYYVYCVAEPLPAQQLDVGSLPAGIEEAAELEWIVGDNLAALTSTVPLKDYKEEALAEHLLDATWTAVRAMRHETVVEYVAKRASVVPLRFGTIYLERAGVEKMLAEKGRELAGVIERLRGREEWGVNVYADRATLLESITSLSPRLRELAQQAEAASPGQSYLMQKKIEALRVDEARATLNGIIDQIEKTLSEQAEDAKRLRILKVEATEHGELKGKFAFLVKRAEFEEFRAAAEGVAEENLSAGVRLELTGPWPAYNFTVFDKA